MISRSAKKRSGKQGYIQAMTRSRLKFDPPLVVNSDLTREGAYEAMNELLRSRRKPTANVASND